MEFLTGFESTYMPDHDVDVLRLVRVRVGPLALGDLAKGAWRHLTPAEVRALGGDARPGRS